MLTLWISSDAIRAFVGEDYELAVIPPEAERLLAGYDERVVHYEVVRSERLCLKLKLPGFGDEGV